MSKHSFTYRFINTQMKPESFKFKWVVCRGDYYDYDAIEADLGISKLLTKLNNEHLSDETKMNIAKEVNVQVVKYKKPYHYYMLFRICENYPNIIRAINESFTVDSDEYKEFIKNSKNVQTYKLIATNECAKTRIFSSLAKMQKYASCHNLGIDVYELYKEGKKGHIEYDLNISPKH